MSIGILQNVNSSKANRDVKQGICVCSRITRLTNNRTKRRTRGTKNAVAIVRIVSQMGCVSQDWEVLDSQRGKQAC